MNVELYGDWHKYFSCDKMSLEQYTIELIELMKVNDWADCVDYGQRTTMLRVRNSEIMVKKVGENSKPFHKKRKRQKAVYFEFLT